MLQRTRPPGRIVLGRQEEQQALLLNLSARKFGALIPAQQRRVEQTESETLLPWTDLVLFTTMVEKALC
ncbi:MAG: hypothetical protein DM484_30295 [Candidatus Methylumidiphilus alinenensis]|uniref:Uncharacterized protein n=1 Tax=Candidatus Methylumidiphilus alinenensis TaxID=2202197 RepID=A0A2W4Q9Z3_9GAMM|nr:MAG: hypothetical protein DM484_30295 [Candidatus Methylumidiphilus alinenensis]